MSPTSADIVGQGETALTTIPRHRFDFKYGAELGQRIYDEKYRQMYEPQDKGKFLAIDLESGIAALGRTSNDAMAEGKKAAPGGFFYVVRIGFPTTFVLR